MQGTGDGLCYADWASKRINTTFHKPKNGKRWIYWYLRTLEGATEIGWSYDVRRTSSWSCRWTCHFFPSILSFAIWRFLGRWSLPGYTLEHQLSKFGDIHRNCKLFFAWKCLSWKDESWDEFLWFFLCVVLVETCLFSSFNLLLYEFSNSSSLFLCQSDIFWCPGYFKHLETLVSQVPASWWLVCCFINPPCN